MPGSHRLVRIAIFHIERDVSKRGALSTIL